MNEERWTDPIVAQTRKWREELMAEAEHDLGRLTQRIMQSQTRHGGKLVSMESGTPLKAGSDTKDAKPR